MSTSGGEEAQDASLASLEEEVGRLSSVKAGVEKERDDLVSVIFEGGFVERPHEKRTLHPRVYGEVEDMQHAADTMHMYCATWSGRFQRGRAIIRLVLLLLLCCCLRCRFRRLACCQLLVLVSLVRHFLIFTQADGLPTAGKLMRAFCFGLLNFGF